MATTQLSVTALPGKRHSFSPKAEASGQHTGLFTELSTSALPGIRQTFTAKTPAVPPVTHEGLFTALSTIACPGRRHSFTKKTAQEIVPTAKTYGGGGWAGPRWKKTGREWRETKRYDEDRELMELAKMIVTSGILD